MRTSPPESSLARLLKFLRVHRSERRKNRDPGIDFSGRPESSLGWIASPEVISACCVSAKDRAVISIAIPEIILRAAPLRVLRFCCIRPQEEVFVQAQKRGRTGFDSSLEAQTACRGSFVCLVKNRTKKQTQTTKVSLSRLN